MCAAFAGADHGDIGDVKFFYGVCGAEKEGVPFAVKRLEFSFGNGKKVDMTDRVSVLSRDCLAGLGKGNFYGEGCKTAGKEKCSCDGGSPVSGEDWGRGLLSLWGQSVVDGPGEKDS